MIKQNDPRRWKERADGSMVREDRSGIANLSPDVMMQEIPHHDIPINPAVPGDIPAYGRPTLMETFLVASARAKR